MTHLRGLAEMESISNPSFLGNWPEKIGRFVLNFGSIELISYQHLLLLESTKEAFEKNLERTLSKRIARILVLLNESKSISIEDKNSITMAWNEVDSLSKWRNRIAHNPVVPSWKPGVASDTNPPDVLGVPDMRDLQLGNTTDALTPGGLSSLINASAKVGRQLSIAAEVLRLGKENGR